MSRRARGGAGLLVLALLATGAGRAEVTVSAGKVDAQPGADASVEIVARGAAGAAAFHVEISFDPAVLEVKGVEKGTLLGANSLLEFNPDEKGKLVVGAIALQAVDEKGPLARVTFAPKGRPGSQSVLKLQNVKAWRGEDHSPMAVKSEDGLVRLPPGRIPLIWVAVLGAAVLVLLGAAAVVARSRRRAVPPTPPAVKERPPAPPPVPPPPVRAVPGARSPPALQLRVRTGPSEGRVFPLSSPCVIGRDAGCTIPIADRSASRRHATIRNGPDGWSLADEGSGNGTWRNGERVQEPVPLREGDEVQIGETRFGVEAPIAANSSTEDVTAALPRSPFCTQCGAPVAPGTRFCATCGQKLA